MAWIPTIQIGATSGPDAAAVRTPTGQKSPQGFEYATDWVGAPVGAIISPTFFRKGRGKRDWAASWRPNLPDLSTDTDLTIPGAGYCSLQAVMGIRSLRSHRSQPGRYPDR